LTYLPNLNEKLEILLYINNPIYEIINKENIEINTKKIIIRKLNNFRHLYYSLRFKSQFRQLLWVKIREPKIMKKYHPSYLLENINEDTDLDELMNDWHNEM